MAQLPRDENRVTTLGGASTLDGITPIPIGADPVTKRLLVDANINATDIEIGAVEIKNSTDDTREATTVDGKKVQVIDENRTEEVTVAQLEAQILAYENAIVELRAKLAEIAKL
jgi:hypothetical protein